MQKGISTSIFLSQRLHTGLLDAMRRGGAQTIEVFAARHHFDYGDRGVVRELATWFRDTGTEATLHQPVYPDAQWSRHVSPTLNLIDPEKMRRIDAMDEVKRALESAEQIPFRAITLHLGSAHEAWSPRALEHSITVIEHLKAFAHPLGVKVLLENLQNEVTAPEHLLEILRVGHFDTVGICLDVGHANLSEGVEAAFELLRPRIALVNLHDNGGMKDEHLWPGSGTVDWAGVARLMATLVAKIPAILEISHEREESAEMMTKNAAEFFAQQERFAEELLRASEA